MEDSTGKNQTLGTPINENICENPEQRLCTCVHGFQGRLFPGSHSEALGASYSDRGQLSRFFISIKNSNWCRPLLTNLRLEAGSQLMETAAMLVE